MIRESLKQRNEVWCSAVIQYNSVQSGVSVVYCNQMESHTSAVLSVDTAIRDKDITQ